ncbi:hypothetical protein [Massilia sp. HP4]|uniref:hypothetical protein n=1 Tax=Massilia sp. HP4 TaxID=2562316 RepID=UPI0010C0555E|nr:hypothetical protein [Massilia sp. HP4]
MPAVAALPNEPRIGGALNRQQVFAADRLGHYPQAVILDNGRNQFIRRPYSHRTGGAIHFFDVKQPILRNME